MKLFLIGFGALSPKVMPLFLFAFPFPFLSAFFSFFLFFLVKIMCELNNDIV